MIPTNGRRDKWFPLAAAGACFLVYRILLYILLPIGSLFGDSALSGLAALTLSSLIAAGVSCALAMALFEGHPLRDVGIAWLRGSGTNFARGVFLGAAAGALSVLPAVALGTAHFHALPEGADSESAALVPVLLFCGALGEEIAFRGFSLQYLMRGYGHWRAILGMGALFGLLHAANPDAGVLSSLNTAGFGAIFGFAVLRSRDLWFPTGMHFAWNTILPVLGVDLSGLKIKVSGYELVWSAGDLWSGGKYGPEASLVTSLLLILLALAVWKMPLSPGSAYLVEASPSA